MIERPERRRLTISARLTALFATTFFVVAVVLIAIAYSVVRNRLLGGPRENDVAAQLELSDSVDGPAISDAILPDGRRVSTLIEQVRADVVADTLSSLLVWMSIATLIVGITAIAIGFFASRRALRPVQQVTDTARRLSGTNLSERVQMSGPDDEISALASTFDDMLDRIESGVDAQRQFAAFASHELRTPLARMRAAVGLARSAPGAITVDEMSDVVEPAVVDATELIDRLLQLTRSQAGVIEPVLVDLAALVSTIAAASQPAAASAAVEMRLDVEGGSALVHGDIVLLKSMVSNLIDNAIVHNRPRGSVVIRIEPSRGCVTLSVCNDGETITEAEIARLHEPFRRAKSNPDQIGHGLGTTIVRTIVRSHGGTFTMLSRPAGGLCVTVELATRSH